MILAMFAAFSEHFANSLRNTDESVVNLSELIISDVKCYLI